MRLLLLQLLRLLLMLLLQLLSPGLIRLLLRESRVFLVVLLLDSLSFLFLRRAEAILLLLVRPIHVGIPGGRNDRLRQSRSLRGMDRSRRSNTIELRGPRIGVRIYRTWRRPVNLAGRRLLHFRWPRRARRR